MRTTYTALPGCWLLDVALTAWEVGVNGGDNGDNPIQVFYVLHFKFLVGAGLMPIY